ncbi:MAG: hypothetical protein H5T43_03790 [Methanomethylovorans sp.]|jgi:glutaredoxin-related protein|nr:hypothetical protein [Methanomethylovorans sp.]
MEKLDVGLYENEERRLRIVPVMVFVDPKCYQCFKLVEALERKGFECNVINVHNASSKKFLTQYRDAISSSQEYSDKCNPHPELDLSDSTYNNIDWDKVPLPFYHPVLLTPEGFYVYDDLFLECEGNDSKVNEDLLNQIMVFLVRMWN